MEFLQSDSSDQPTPPTGTTPLTAPCPLRRFATRQLLQRLAFGLFLLYLAVFPGSTLTVAAGRVPAWGEWMGGALLLLQGAIVVCWLIGGYGRRGALAAALVFVLAWAVEHLGVTTGFPFGRYHYTTQLSPQPLGAVPLAIPCAWLMLAIGANDLRFLIFGSRLHQDDQIKNLKSKIQNWVVVATLMLLLDVQIEPVATAINRYWVWLDGGAYYDVPAANFVAWWAVGLVIAAVVGRVLSRVTVNGFGGRIGRTIQYNRQNRAHFTFYVLRLLFRFIPTSLYLLNTLMFTAINLAWGYVLAGMVGATVLCVFALIAVSSISQRSFDWV
jgi:bisanhydrobacterioruberin hydratase